VYLAQTMLRKFCVSPPVKDDAKQIKPGTSVLLKNEADDSKQNLFEMKIVTLVIAAMVFWILQDQLYLRFAQKHGGVDAFQKLSPEYQLWHYVQEWQLHVYEKYEDQFKTAHCGTYWANVYGFVMTYMLVTPPASGYSALGAIGFSIFSLVFTRDPFSVGPVGFRAIKIMVTAMFYTEFNIDTKRCMCTGLLQYVLCSGIMQESECWLRHGFCILILFRIYETKPLVPWLLPWCRMMCNFAAPAVALMRGTVTKNAGPLLRKIGSGIWEIMAMLWTLIVYVGMGLDCMFINRHESVCTKKRPKKSPGRLQ